MRKIVDAGTYRSQGKDVTIAHMGRSDQHNAGRVANTKKYDDGSTGTGMEDLYAIMNRYHIKGFEFGNWVTQEERAEYVGSLGTTLEELYSVVGSRNLGFDRNVGIAFGARGRRGARAHYEPVLNMINLTRMKGAGSLAHEYGHAIDYNLGGFVDQNKIYTSLSGGHSTAATLPENVGGILRHYVNQIVDSIRNGKNFAKMDEINKAQIAMGGNPIFTDYYYRRTEIFARFFEQYVCYCLYQRGISNRLLVKSWETYSKELAYVQKDDFLKIKPVADKLMKELNVIMSSTRSVRARAAAYPKPVIAKPKQEPKKLTNPKATAAPKRTAATKSEAAKTVKKKVIKPLGGFVLTNSGKLCTSSEVVSKWGSNNIKTWKRIYLVRLYDDDKTASISGRFLICLKNGQYYFGDAWGQAAIDFDQSMTEEWGKFIHPQGAKKPAVRRVGLNYSEYSFRDQNEAFAFAEHTHKRKVDSNMQGVDSKAFNMLLKDMYEMEYMYVQYPSRRGVKVSLWKNGEKPKKVNTITQK